MCRVIGSTKHLDLRGHIVQKDCVDPSIAACQCPSQLWLIIDIVEWCLKYAQRPVNDWPRNIDEQRGH